MTVTPPALLRESSQRDAAECEKRRDARLLLASPLAQGNDRPRRDRSRPSGSTRPRY
jgi:hypothetical protein